MLIKIAKILPLPSFRSNTKKRRKIEVKAAFSSAAFTLKKNTKSSYRAYGQRSLLGSKQHLVDAEWKKHKHFGCE